VRGLVLRDPDLFFPHCDSGKSGQPNPNLSGKNRGKERRGKEIMKRTRIMLSLLVIISVILGAGLRIYAQPNISREKIPSYIPDDIRILIERLYSSDPVERARAAYILGEMRKEANPSTPYLMGMLGDSSAIGQTLENYSVGLIETTPGVPTSPGEEAAKALVKIKGGGALTPLAGALKDKDSRVRYSAVCGLGKMAEPAVEPLIGALRDSDIRVREGAAWALGKIKDARSVEPLIGALKDEDLVVRENGAWSLRQIIWTMNDFSLAKMRDPRIIEPLIRALKDEDMEVRKYTEETLETITRRDLGQDPVKWQEWWEQNKGNFLRAKT
jgi:bilin biosynthesis protein